MSQVPAKRAAESSVTRDSFSTMSVPEHLRVPLWEEYNRRLLLDLRCRTLSEAGLRAALHTVGLGRLRLTELASYDHVVERAPEHIRAAPSGTMFLCLLLRGDAFVYHPGGTELVSAGDAILFNADTPYVYGFPNRLHELILHVDHDLYAERNGGIDVRRPRIIHGADGTAVRTHIRAALRVFRRAMTGAPDFGDDAALDLFDLVTGGEGSSASGYWRSAREYIRRHLREPALSVQQVASAVGISERHLARVFAERSTTVAQTISDQRIQRARELLLDPNRRTHAIADIAVLSGYTSPSQFARTFRKAYGCSAREMRRACPAGETT